jgi:CubicO group peptidase (beta-lactamase class C family)
LRWISIKRPHPASREDPVLRLAAAVPSVDAHTDAPRQGVTIEDMLTMQSGLARKESGYAYEPASDNGVVAMTDRWPHGRARHSSTRAGDSDLVWAVVTS